MEQCNNAGHTLRSHHRKVVEKASKESNYNIHGKENATCFKIQQHTSKA